MSDELTVSVFPIEKVEEYIKMKENAWKSYIPSIAITIYDGISSAILNDTPLRVDIDMTKDFKNQKKALDYVIKAYVSNGYRIISEEENESGTKVSLEIRVAKDNDVTEKAIIPSPDFIK